MRKFVIAYVPTETYEISQVEIWEDEINEMHKDEDFMHLAENQLESGMSLERRLEIITSTYGKFSNIFPSWVELHNDNT